MEQNKTKLGIGAVLGCILAPSVLIVVAIAVAMVVFWTTTRPPTLADDGGVEILLRVDGDDAAVDEAAAVLGRRVAEFGSADALVQRYDTDQISVRVAGEQDAAQLTAVLTRPGHLEFRAPDGTVGVDGTMVARATVEFDPFDLPYVALELDDRGKQAFCDLSGDHVGEVIAIAVDGSVLSEPTVMEPICGGKAQIALGNQGSAESRLAEAQGLAIALNAGELPAPVEVVETNVLYPGE